MTVKRPVISSDICEEAQQFLANLIELLEEQDILTSLDTSALELLGYTYDNYIKATRIIQKKGFTLRSPRGEEKSRPEVKIQIDSLIQINKIMDSFGLNPRARKEISKPKERTEVLTDIDIFLNKNKEVR
jgi:P27 family predicted phage terminase small subunit